MMVVTIQYPKCICSFFSVLVKFDSYAKQRGEERVDEIMNKEMARRTLYFNVTCIVHTKTIVKIKLQKQKRFNTFYLTFLFFNFLCLKAEAVEDKSDWFCLKKDLSYWLFCLSNRVFMVTICLLFYFFRLLFCFATYTRSPEQWIHWF